ncbi:hypothetical protein BO221_26025 [Archangium sp. Cb G35]|uniref:hypothetical protein n=1 Tax=Archangium sp. Cb G35 TaxID=1920190 RepID=UPI000937A51B|nr:hypothetical protein [Archangium sp. Cb G35]OJT21289.1 hypothetical protein BO221_26025 [Archangium sp. Cb G35]
MKKQLLSAVVLCALSVVGCEEDLTPTPDAGTTDTDAGTDAGTEIKYNTADKVFTFLEGKTMVMEGANIPSHPNGINENLLYDPSTQCYNKVTMQMASRNLTVTSVRAVVEGASGQGSVGDCNRDNIRDTLAPFVSTVVNIENVKEDGTCFDITATFNGFSQSGRGLISQDGTKVQLELYFAATGHRCADGAVGANTVKLNGNAFTGNAIQTYVIQ